MKMRGYQAGSRAIAWAAILISSSSGFLRPSAVDVAKPVHVFLIFICRWDWAALTSELYEILNYFPVQSDGFSWKQHGLIPGTGGGRPA